MSEYVKDARRLRTGLPLLDDHFGVGKHAGVTLFYCDGRDAESAVVALFDRLTPHDGLDVLIYEQPTLSIEQAHYLALRSKDVPAVMFVSVPQAKDGPQTGGRIHHMVDVVVNVSGTPDRIVMEFAKNRWGWHGAVALTMVDGKLREIGLTEAADE